MPQTPSQHGIQRICVFCGSNFGNSSAFADAAEQLAKSLVKHGIDLVYGGASVGMMGVIADTVLTNGGKVYGVIPKILERVEITHYGLSELHVVENMHQRKALMAELADAFITLPGGIGTLEELFEVWTWNQLSIHNKPLGLLNVAGYYDHLLAFLENSVTAGYMRREIYQRLLVCSEADDLVQQLLSYSLIATD